MHRFRRGKIPVVLLLTALLLSPYFVNTPQGTANAQATKIAREWSGYNLNEPFVRSPADVDSPSGHQILTNCQDLEGDYPYAPYDWPNAKAVLELAQRNGESTVKVEIVNARPDTYFTMWLRLRGEDKNGIVYGGSPLSGSPGTPLAPSSLLPELVAATGEGNGNDQNPNGFWSDADGNAYFTIALDFPLINGAYPFHRYTNFDSIDERLKAEQPAIYPVAIVGKNGPFTLRIVSHCTDGLGHGLSSGAREWWFHWKFE